MLDALIEKRNAVAKQAVETVGKQRPGSNEQGTDEMTDKPAITPKQSRFCEEYVVDHNATQAAIRAGYSAASAKEQGYRLLTKDHVQAHVAELHAAYREQMDTTIDNLTQKLREAGKLAHQEGQAGAAVQAAMGEAKLHGHLVDKHEDVTPVDDMSPAELAACMAELDRKLIAAMPEADLRVHEAYLQGQLVEVRAKLAGSSLAVVAGAGEPTGAIEARDALPSSVAKLTMVED